MVGVPTHVLRFWETKFEFVQPVKRAGGRRFYRPADIEALKAVKRRLHDEGLTIKGVQKLHRDGGLDRVAGPEVEAPATQVATDRTAARDAARAALIRVEAAKARLDAALAS